MVYMTASNIGIASAIVSTSNIKKVQFDKYFISYKFRIESFVVKHTIQSIYYIQIYTSNFIQLFKIKKFQINNNFITSKKFCNVFYSSYVYTCHAFYSLICLLASCILLPHMFTHAMHFSPLYVYKCHMFLYMDGRSECVDRYKRSVNYWLP